jgi:hypothetical protein
VKANSLKPGEELKPEELNHNAAFSFLASSSLSPQRITLRGTGELDVLQGGALGVPSQVVLRDGWRHDPCELMLQHQVSRDEVVVIPAGDGARIGGYLMLDLSDTSGTT